MGKGEILRIGHEKVNIDLLMAGSSPAESLDQLPDSKRDAVMLHLGETKQKLQEVIEQQKENKTLMLYREDPHEGNPEEPVEFNGGIDGSKNSKMSSLFSTTSQNKSKH